MIFGKGVKTIDIESIRVIMSFFKRQNNDRTYHLGTEIRFSKQRDTTSKEKQEMAFGFVKAATTVVVVLGATTITVLKSASKYLDKGDREGASELGSELE